MIKPRAFIFLILMLVCGTLLAQDTLPSFNVTAVGNKRNLISWTNTYRYISQINIQRSSDSLRNFKTIMTVPDPMAVENGFLDTKAPGAVAFYRLFIVLEAGKYEFTRSKRPAPDTASALNEMPLEDNQQVVLSENLDSREITTLKNRMESKATPKPSGVAEKFFVVNKYGVYRKVLERNFKRFHDSIVHSTRDTIVFLSVDTALIKPYAVPPAYTASKYVYTERFGNVMISLPDAKQKKYSVSFFEENRTPLFEIDEVKTTKTDGVMKIE